MPSAASSPPRSAASAARLRGPTPINSVASLTPHLYAPDAVRPLRAKEHFLSADTLVELHEHPWPQLTFSTRGVIRLSTQDGSYIVPPSRALWVPANMVGLEPAPDGSVLMLGTGSHRYEVTFKGPGGHSYGAFGQVPSAIHGMSADE